MSARLSRAQREALDKVAWDHVTYGDPFPGRLARRVARDRAAGVIVNVAAYANPVVLLDGFEVYGGEHATYASLFARGLIEGALEPDGSPGRVDLTEAGRDIVIAPDGSFREWRGDYR